jgi:RNA polymerase sigma-70 factor (ECF subfamily)
MEQTGSTLREEEVSRLVDEARRGNEASFARLVKLFERTVFNLAFRMTDNHADASDLTQEIFVKLYRSLGKFRGESRFSTWLYALAANHCRSGLRRLRRIGFFERRSLDAGSPGAMDARPPPEPADPGDPPSRTLERRELEARIGGVIARLPAELKTTLILRDMQGLSYEEVAEALGCSIGTVKSRLWRARFRVKEELGGENGHAV